MPGNGANEQGGSNGLLITAVSLLLLILITALSRHRYRQDLHRRAQDRHWEAIWGRREQPAALDELVPFAWHRHGRFPQFNVRARNRLTLPLCRTPPDP